MPRLSVLGTGVYLPPVRVTAELAAEVGADPSWYRGWERVLVAGDDDHPSTMGAAALRQALDEAEVNPSELRVMVFAGMSRDYLPSWSVATEVMSLVGAPGDCVGLDVTLGCLGALAGLNTALGWLAQDGGGFGAVVAAERWSYTVDRSRTDLMGLWGHADGAGALVVGLDVATPALGDYVGSAFCTYPEDNGRVLIRYGGTRAPVAPAGMTPYHREMRPGPLADVRDRYLAGYGAALEGLRRQLGAAPEWLVLNQLSPGLVAMIPAVAEVTTEHTMVTGPETGHLGTADIFLGLRRVLRRSGAPGPIVLAASTPYAFGAGLMVPPQT